MLRIIGDIHSERSIYLNAVNGSKYSLQLGDLDYDYTHLKDLDSDCHRFLPGNHDNYDALPKHALGDFGTWDVPEFGPVFFVRGAWSMDWRARINKDEIRYGMVARKKDLWDQEELTVPQCYKAYEAYNETKPKFVASHTCPESIGIKMSKSRTSNTLEAMWQAHHPKTWVFGHWHTNFDEEIDGTRFICVNICRYIDLEY